MSLLWTQAMAWFQSPEDSIEHNPIHVRHAGFAGYVGDSEDDDELAEDSGVHPHNKNPWESGFDEDMYDKAHEDTVTPEDEAHMEEHDEYPEDYYDRRDNAYLKAHEEKRRKAEEEDRPDYEDPDLRRFISKHGSDTPLWQNKGHLGQVNLREPVYATQTHVAQDHIDRYLNDPKSLSWHSMKYGPSKSSRYLGDETPLFVTHEGRLHAIEGHHRVAAALQSGQPHIHAWHFDLDKHPEYGREEEDEDY